MAKDFSIGVDKPRPYAQIDLSLLDITNVVLKNANLTQGSFELEMNPSKTMDIRVTLDSSQDAIVFRVELITTQP